MATTRAEALALRDGAAEAVRDGALRGGQGARGGRARRPRPFVATCHLYFNNVADFQKGIGTHSKEIMGDIPNYTDIAPQIQISEIVVS